MDSPEEKKTDAESIPPTELTDVTPANGEGPSNSEPSIEHIQSLLETAQKELLYQRAEFENVRKRMSRDQDQAIKFSNEKIIREILGVIDLFDRALELAPKLKLRLAQDSEVVNFLTGIELTHRELIQKLQKFGVEFIASPGETFDPQRHEAISQEITDDSEKDETVVRVLQRGCLLQGRLLSPARVVVAKLQRNEA